MTASRQDEIFTAFEGNKWFERNKAALGQFDPTTDFPIKLMELYRLQPRAVLEVGAANGVRLAALHARWRARVVGLEPSAEAVLDGSVKFPGVKFVRGTSHALPFRTRFDLVIVHGVCCWIDRANLLGSIAELDRVLNDGGFLIIGDFCPVNLTRVHYHHLPGGDVHTYKQDYAATFLASGLYHRVGLLTFDHASRTLSGDVDESQRFGVSLLRKALGAHYADATVSHGSQRP